LDDLFLGRLGYMGADEFLGLRDLDFHPETGHWYHFRIVVCGNRIQVYLNNEQQPRIDITDKNMDLAPAGYVTLGGSWIETEFDDLSIRSLPDNYLTAEANEYAVRVTPQEKEAARKAARANYRPVVVDQLADARTIVPLDGNWLFLPDYQLDQAAAAIAPTSPDADWHVMHVPDFWNPIRIWLHGETFNSNTGTHAKGVSDPYFQQETERCKNYTFDYQKTKAAWYRQWITLPEEIEGKNLTLTFDAISKIAEIYINGHWAGSHIGMFGEIKIDGTPFFRPGENVVTVHVIKDPDDAEGHSPLQPDYYSLARLDEDPEKKKELAAASAVTNQLLKGMAHGFYGDDPAGIWQPVQLEISGPVRIEDVFIQPHLTGAVFEVTVKNYTSKKQTVSLFSHIADRTDHSLLYSGESLNRMVLNAGEEKTFAYRIDSLRPKLWTPNHPNLYDFRFSLFRGKQQADELTICSGFRTFESKDGYLLLNGNRYWLRGGNHTPFALAPNDEALANKFYQLMKAAHIDITRTHTTPYNKLWIEAADRNGIGISHEGTWPWLMIQSSMPEESLIRLWADEYIGLLKKYRNHPSILFWTINNEMKFYDNEPDFEKAQQKMQIISEVVRRIRAIDPTRPVCFDSNYRRNIGKFGEDFFTRIDDGDIDDVHAYINWYDHTVFKQFNGEFQRGHLNPERPLISQEMSTGDPNTETGHPTRFYTFVHQNPQVLVGQQAYDFGHPDYFLEAQSFITGELAEALRRSNPHASGMLHFALLTWFRNVYHPQTIEPYPTYHAIRRAFSPILVSAELWGRHFYAGTRLPVRICIANDQEDGSDLPPSELRWEIQADGRAIASGNQRVPTVRHYGRWWMEPEIHIPANLPTPRTDARLVLKLHRAGAPITENEYKITLATKDWAAGSKNNAPDMVLVDFAGIKTAFDFLSIPHKACATVSEAFKHQAPLYVFAGLDTTQNCSEAELRQIRTHIANGGKVLMLDGKEAAQALYPEHIAGWIIPTEGDIVNPEIPESAFFNGLEWMDLRYFNNNKREIPTVCHAALKVNRSPQLTEFTSQTKIHGYITGEMEQRSAYVQTIRGTTLVEIRDNGSLLLSTFSLEKAATDPIAGKLLTNMMAAFMAK
jgi:hypothetical protein